eukprot:m.232746 g.232746  ORF g.232746 m.232746 type:complete len:292 (+) comp15721_c0_seq4:463-1338(+)
MAGGLQATTMKGLRLSRTLMAVAAWIASTSPPTFAAFNHCSAHRQCHSISFCNASRTCDHCASCTAEASVTTGCPFKCMPFLQVTATPPTTLAPTGAPHCHTHRQCAVNSYCSASGRCARCASCSDDPTTSIDGLCPNQCASLVTVVPECQEHFNCNSTAFCHLSAVCAPCSGYGIDGNPAANCTATSSITGLCPTKCQSSLGPVAVDSATPATDDGMFGLVGVLVFIALAVAVAVAVVALTAVRRARRRPLPIPVNSTLTTTVENLEWDSRDLKYGPGWVVRPLTLKTQT